MRVKVALSASTVRGTAIKGRGGRDEILGSACAIAEIKRKHKF